MALCRAFPFSRPSAQGPIPLGSGALSLASRRATELPQPRGHPFLRSQKPFQNCRNIKIRIQFRKVNAEARGCHLNVLKFCRRRVFQALRVARRKTDLQIGTQSNYNSPASRVESRRLYSGGGFPQRFPAPTRQFELIIRCHEFPPKPGKADATIRPARIRSSRRENP